MSLNMSNVISIKKNLIQIKQHIANLAEKYGRNPHEIQLLAASKGQSVEKIVIAFDEGQRLFGENYLQEALLKMQLLAVKPIEWHFIGTIQANKTRKIAKNFSWVHSVSNAKIAKRLHDQRNAHLQPLNICIEVNISNEPHKSGAAPQEVLSLCQYCLHLPRLRVRGLMAIPAPQKNFEDMRAQFHKVAELANQLRAEKIPLDTLSMGMSEDFEAAIAEGATIVRIGTAIFGPRK